MKILITGGSGFIGAQVVRLLLEQGETNIAVFDINPSSRLLGDVKDQVEVFRGDLGNMSHVLDVVKAFNPDVIFHLGGMLTVPSEEDHASAFRVNAIGTFNILESARLYDVQQVLFSSSIATYGLHLSDNEISDYTLQRPQLFYGATKLFCEHLGLFYRRKFNLDFRGLRFASIVGPGVKTPGVAQYTSWAIEECAKGNPYTIYVKPETRCPVMYYKDAARALVKLREAPSEDIKMVNYVAGGPSPIASAKDLAELIKSRIPKAKISFDPDLELQAILDKLLLPFDDRIAREEWKWVPKYDQESMVDDFIEELRLNPERYV